MCAVTYFSGELHWTVAVGDWARLLQIWFIKTIRNEVITLVGIVQQWSQNMTSFTKDLETSQMKPVEKWSWSEINRWRCNSKTGREEPEKKQDSSNQDHPYACKISLQCHCPIIGVLRHCPVWPNVALPCVAQCANYGLLTMISLRLVLHRKKFSQYQP